MAAVRETAAKFGRSGERNSATPSSRAAAGMKAVSWGRRASGETSPRLSAEAASPDAEVDEPSPGYVEKVETSPADVRQSRVSRLDGWLDRLTFAGRESNVSDQMIVRNTQSFVRSTTAKFNKGARDLDNEADADRVVARHLWREHRLLPPSSVFKKRWTILLFFFVVYACIFYPVYPAFKMRPHQVQIGFEFAMDAAFWIDILLNFRTAYTEDDGQLVTSPQALATRYVTSWLGVDVLATFPLEVFAAGDPTRDADRTAGGRGGAGPPAAGATGDDPAWFHVY